MVNNNNNQLEPQNLEQAKDMLADLEAELAREKANSATKTQAWHNLQAEFQKFRQKTEAEAKRSHLRSSSRLPKDNDSEEIKKLNQDKSKLKEQLKQSQAEQVRLQTNYNDLANQHQILEQEFNQLKIAKERLSREYSSLLANRNSTVNIQELLEQIAQIKEQLKQSQQEKEQAELQKRQADRARERYQTECENLREQNKIYRQRADENVLDNVQLKLKLQSCLQELAEQVKECQELTAQVQVPNK